MRHLELDVRVVLLCLAMASGWAGLAPAALALDDEWPASEFGTPTSKGRALAPARKSPASDAPPAEPTVRDTASATAPTVAAAKGTPDAFLWNIRHATWSEADEKRFQEFVRRIGESRCRTTHQCLTEQTANPAHAASNPAGLHFYADCADLPYLLRAYFAWKNSLPFSFATAVRPLGWSRDIRYTAHGNAVSQRRDLVETPIDIRRALPQITGISSAVYRTPPSSSGALLPDHYPVAITRESIKPGTIIYDPNGHVAVVYKVGDDGRIHYIDTHPDNSLTRGVYGRKFARATPSMGAGFKRWRPVRLLDARRNSDGTYTGGRIDLAADRQLSDWSDEQFYGTVHPRSGRWQDGRFVIAGATLDYYDFVRFRLASANFRFDPVAETRAMVKALCEDLSARVDAVDAGIASRPQPERLPVNIYGTEGDWETYSTPSRDARLKTAFKELRDEIVRFLTLSAERSPQIGYDGPNLPAALASAYLAEAEACRITYSDSDGRPRTLRFEEIRSRLFAMSFDPHHCVERRWGATRADELASCKDDPLKARWYAAEQRLRNQIERTYELRMDLTLGELESGRPGSGVDMAPDIDVLAVLKATQGP